MRSVNVVIMLEAHQQEFTSYFPTNANICGHMQRMTAARDSSCELQVTHFNSGIIYIPYPLPRGGNTNPFVVCKQILEELSRLEGVMSASAWSKIRIGLENV